MAVRPILLYPDAILKTPSAPAVPGDPTVASIIQDMLDTLQASLGVALAAPQIGHAVQIIVVDVSRKQGETGHGRIVLLNPRITHQDEERIVREGCLIPYTVYRLLYSKGSDPRCLRGWGFCNACPRHTLHLISR
ncbi:MAG: peptide deformylase [Nitrospira sp.]